MPERAFSSPSTLVAEAGLRGRPDFDPELYTDACSILAEQETACESKKARLALHHTWFRDAFFPETKISQLEQANLIPPYLFSKRTDQLFYDEHAPYIRSTSGARSWEMRERIKTMLYGDRVFTNIQSGVIANIPPTFGDIVGTGELDCCQAFAGVRQNGTLCLTHIPGPGHWTAQDILPSLLNDPDLAHACFLYPDLPVDGYLDPRDAFTAQKANEAFLELADKWNLPSIAFPSSSVPGYHRSPLSGLRTLVTIEQDGLCFSVNQETILGRYPHSTPHYRPIKTNAFLWE